MLKLLRGALCALVLTAATSGCIALAVGAAGGAAGITYLKGDMTDKLDGTVAEVHAATLMALEELDMPIHESDLESYAAKIRTRYSDEKTVWIDIETINSASSKITLRVGATGNQRRSLHILDAIKANL